MSLSETHIVLMGVCGCGKSTVGEALSALTGIPFLDADALHPATNVAKMRAGIPLDDADRAPWLRACGQAMAQAEGGLILGCSALKAGYREIIRRQGVTPVFVYLHGARALLRARLGARQGHFMPTTLLDSQLATLEVPTAEENALTVDIAQPAEVLARQIHMRLTGRVPVARAA